MMWQQTVYDGDNVSTSPVSSLVSQRLILGAELKLLWSKFAMQHGDLR